MLRSKRRKTRVASHCVEVENEFDQKARTTIAHRWHRQTAAANQDCPLRTLRRTLGLQICHRDGLSTTRTVAGFPHPLPLIFGEKAPNPLDRVGRRSLDAKELPIFPIDG